ncbi:MAG: hypothetical protein P8K08_09785 [Fuerstiella sp.]|nr:hypothetical protein [Fuerstiella sp.]
MSDRPLLGGGTSIETDVESGGVSERSFLIAADDTGSWKSRNCYRKAIFAATSQWETLFVLL